jgi:hypothetical protein
MSEPIKTDLHRRRIDSAFQRMSQDSAYQEEAELIAAEFEESDWEALETGEGLCRSFWNYEREPSTPESH